MNFFKTAIGRKVTFYSATATTLGLCLGNFLPHTLGLQHYKSFVQCYENGIERPVPEKVLTRLETAFNLLELRGYERAITKPFSVYGFDLFLAGSTKYRFGALLGIPVNYAYADVSDINDGAIRFRDKAIDWDSETGTLLKESLVLTDEEQIFGFCKSILQLRTHRVLLNSIYPSAAFLAVYTMGNYLNNSLGLLARPVSIRFVIYGILSLFGFGLWSFMKDFTQVSYDADIDKKLAAMGPKFVECGVSFYEKILKRNIALRHLIGDDTYTSKGNVNYLLRQKSMPLTLRKSFFEEKWQEMKEGAQGAPEIKQ